MLKLGPKDYPLCLLDTNAVSEVLKHRDREFRNYLDWSLGTTPIHVPTFSLFTVLELRRSPALYEKFTEVFKVVPCAVLKSYSQLVHDEIDAYPDPSHVDPCAITFAGPLAGDANLAAVLDHYFRSDEGQDRERMWNAGQAEIVSGICSRVPNFPPKNKTYTPREVRTFLEIAGFVQIAYHDVAFAQHVVDSGEAVEIDAFPAVKAVGFTVFHKFYVDKARAPSDSDAFDLIISSAAPYVEAIVTENHQAEVLRKTQRRDDFISHLRIFTLGDFRDGAP